MTFRCLFVAFLMSFLIVESHVRFLVDDMGWMDSTPYGLQYYETINLKWDLTGVKA